MWAWYHWSIQKQLKEGTGGNMLVPESRLSLLAMGKYIPSISSKVNWLTLHQLLRAYQSVLYALDWQAIVGPKVGHGCYACSAPYQLAWLTIRSTWEQSITWSQPTAATPPLQPEETLSPETSSPEA